MPAKCIETHFKNAYITPPFFTCRVTDFQKALEITMSQAHQSTKCPVVHNFCATYTVTAITKWVKFKLTKFSRETTTTKT